MAVEGPQPVKWSFRAGADLSASQYKILELATSGKVSVADGATDKPIGVLQNKPTSGETAEVVVSGITKVQADADISIGDTIKTSADGQAAKLTHGTDTTHYAIGILLQDPGAAGDIVAAYVDCAPPTRGA